MTITIARPATQTHASASPIRVVLEADAGRSEGVPLAISEIAYLLGYSEPAAFHRAFKRWYATTPEHFRTR
jgi:AraC-like DNA-binding protein